jgi:5-methylcytosine-specific restriction endonuclease McrA
MNDLFYNILFIAAIIFFIYYKIYARDNKSKENRRSDIEREKEFEILRKDYKLKQENVILETKPDQKRPDDWSMRKSYIKGRDGYQCALCGSSTSLQVHHKKPVSGIPDHSGNNLITLCIYCHAKQQGKGHGDRLINSEITKQSDKYRYDKRKSRNEYTCNTCGSIINKGTFSYVKKSNQVNCRWVSSNHRICEDCLLTEHKYRNR